MRKRHGLGNIHPGWARHVPYGPETRRFCPHIVVRLHDPVHRSLLAFGQIVVESEVQNRCVEGQRSPLVETVEVARPEENPAWKSLCFWTSVSFSSFSSLAKPSALYLYPH